MNTTDSHITRFFAELPRRLFLDSSTLQALQTYGEYVYDGGIIETGDRLRAIPSGFENIEALRMIMFVGQRAQFEMVISDNSLKEGQDRGRKDYLNWAYEILGYWRDYINRYKATGQGPLTGAGINLAQQLGTGSFGYLSRKDALLVRDAVLLECDAFITMDRKLTVNDAHIEGELNLKLLEPADYWEMLEPYAPLFV